MKMFQAYGANPEPDEVLGGLHRAADGRDGRRGEPVHADLSAKLQEVQKYLSLTGHVYTPAYLTVGAKQWESAARRRAQDLEDTAKETQAFVYETARRTTRTCSAS